MGGKVGVLLAVRAATDAIAKAPAFDKLVADDSRDADRGDGAPALNLSASEMPADAKAKQSDMFDAQLAEDPKAPPAASHPKIIEGKLGKWAKEICFLDQPSVLEGDKTVEAKSARQSAKELGGDVVFSRFVRFERGEGIEKPTGDDFAAEVAKMAGV